METRFADPVVPAERIGRNPAALENPFVTGAGQVIDAVEKVQRQDEAVQAQIDESNFRIQKRAQEQADRALSLQQSARLAEIQGHIDTVDTDLRQAHVPGRDDYEKGLTGALEAAFKEFDAGFGDNDRVRREFAGNVARFRARMLASGHGFMVEQNARANVAAFEQASNLFVNNARAAASREGLTGERFAEDMANIDRMVAALPAAAQAHASASIRQSYVDAVADGAIDGGNVAQVKLLHGEGFFNGYLDPRQHEALGKKIDLTEQMQVRAAEAAQSKARDEARDAMSLIEKQIAAGIDVPDAQVRQVQAAARAAGVPQDELFDTGLAATKNAINRQFRNASADMMEMAVTQAQQRIAAGKAADADYVLVKHLEGVADKKRDDAARQRQEAWQSGASGQAKVLAELNALSPQQRFAEANRVADGLGYVTGLPPSAQQLAVTGQAYRKAEKTIVSDKDIRESYGRLVGSAARIYGAATEAGLRDSAANIYAALAYQANIKEFSPSIYKKALDIQFGMTVKDGQRYGGLGEYRGSRVILPGNFRQADFDTLMSRFGFANAVDARGGTVSKAAIQRYFYPRYAGEDQRGTLYEFYDGNGRPLLHKSGGPYNMVVRH